MNGHIVVPNLIAVDFWKENAVRYHFLTHCHGDHVSPKLVRWTKKIYTSKLNCKILQLLYNVPGKLLVELRLGETRPVGDFQVTALDADHCPGSIALLFQGEFGTVLYTGDMRYRPGLLEEPALQYVLRSGGGIDKLYLDNTYCSPECVFPQRQDVLEQVIRYLKEYGDCDVYIGMRDLGKESAVLAIAEALETRVHVSKSRLRLLEQCAPSPRWTTVEGTGRVLLVPFRQISQYSGGGGQTSGGRLRVALLLTALFTGSQLPAPYSGGRVQVFPYSDHSSFPELCELVRRIRPRQVLPLVKRWATRSRHIHRDLSPRADMSLFRTYLMVDCPARQAALQIDSSAGPVKAQEYGPPAGRGSRDRAKSKEETGSRTVEELSVRTTARPSVPAKAKMDTGGQQDVRKDRREGSLKRMLDKSQELLDLLDASPFPPSQQVDRASGMATQKHDPIPGEAPQRELHLDVAPQRQDPASGGAPEKQDLEPDGAAQQQSSTSTVMEDRPCPFLMVGGRLERLDRVLSTQEQVDQWLAGADRPPVHREVSICSD